MSNSSMDGVTCLVTGTSSGIGAATAVHLAAMGATVLAVTRDRKRGERAAAELRERVPHARLESLTANLSCLDEVRALAASIQDRHDRLDVLINNAGVAKFRPEDGTMVFSTNHLGPFLLTNLLRDLLVRSAPARVITVSSAWHKQVRSIPWERLERDHACTYEESKLLNVVFSQELARHLNGTGVTANCLSPGFVRTRLGRDATGAFRLLLRVTRPIQTTADKGAQTSVHLASAPEVATVTGGYFENRRQAEPSVLARDQTAAERLWRLSAKLTGLDPD